MVDAARPHGAISIHALLAESDRMAVAGIISRSKFLSTLSLRRATKMARADNSSA